MELLIVIAIASILVALAAPGFRSVFLSKALASFSSDLASDLARARAEALQRGDVVTLAPTDGASLLSGWLIFIDRNGNGLADEGEPVLHRRMLDRGPLRLDGFSLVRFNSSGWLIGPRSLNLSVCTTSSATDGRAMNVNAIGRVSSISLVC